MSAEVDDCDGPVGAVGGMVAVSIDGEGVGVGSADRMSTVVGPAPATPRTTNEAGIAAWGAEGGAEERCGVAEGGEATAEGRPSFFGRSSGWGDSRETFWKWDRSVPVETGLDKTGVGSSGAAGADGAADCNP